MDIQGLQKMTLLDYPGRVACTVFLAGCNFRCPFCHNSELLSQETPGIMDEKALLAFLKSRTGILDGVAFTGGEPLMRKDLPALFREVKALGYPIKLDTNGAYPERLKELVREGLVDYVAMDIKNAPSRYAETCGLSDMGYRSEEGRVLEVSERDASSVALPGSLLAKVEESKDFLIERGKEDDAFQYEFRTTAVSQFHDEDTFRAIGPWIRGAKKWYLQAFIDRETVPFAGLSAPSKEELRRYFDLVKPYVECAEIRGSEA